MTHLTPTQLRARAASLDHESSLYLATGMRRAAKDAHNEAVVLRQLADEADEFHLKYGTPQPQPRRERSHHAAAPNHRLTTHRTMRAA